MKNLLLTVLGACVAMLLTSGVVAFATASSAPLTAVAASVPIDASVDVMSDEQIEARIGELIDAQYQALVARR